MVDMQVIIHVAKYSSGMLSAAASLGLSLLWDTDEGLSQVDKYTYLSEEYIKVSVSTRGLCNCS